MKKTPVSNQTKNQNQKKTQNKTKTQNQQEPKKQKQKKQTTNPSPQNPTKPVSIPALLKVPAGDANFRSAGATEQVPGQYLSQNSKKKDKQSFLKKM